VNVDENLPNISADRDAMVTVLVNLLDVADYEKALVNIKSVKV